MKPVSGKEEQTTGLRCREGNQRNLIVFSELRHIINSMRTFETRDIMLVLRPAISACAGRNASPGAGERSPAAAAGRLQLAPGALLPALRLRRPGAFGWVD